MLTTKFYRTKNYNRNRNYTFRLTNLLCIVLVRSLYQTSNYAPTYPISTERVELGINIAFAITGTMGRMLARSIVLATVNKSTLREFQDQNFSHMRKHCG